MCIPRRFGTTYDRAPEVSDTPSWQCVICQTAAGGVCPSFNGEKWIQHCQLCNAEPRYFTPLSTDWNPWAAVTMEQRGEGARTIPLFTVQHEMLNIGPILVQHWYNIILRNRVWKVY